jgi:hypothetical protein
MKLWVYAVTGWSPRFGQWVTEPIEAQSMEAALRRFRTHYPTLKQVKAYALKER